MRRIQKDWVSKYAALIEEIKVLNRKLSVCFYFAILGWFLLTVAFLVLATQ